jgi:type VI secretion system protein ImpA
LDYKLLLTPIEADAPCGIYLKGERAQYRALRNTFNAAQSSFRRLIETPESSNDDELFEENQKNWQAVNDACWQTLTEKSKDVEIYCWWVMSLVFQQEAIDKIAAGLATLTPFIEQFWPDVNPCLPDNKLKSSEVSEQASERAELQLRPLIQLVGESQGSGLLYMPLQMLSLVGEIDHAKYLSAVKSNTLPELVTKARQQLTSYKDETTETVKALGLAIESVEQLDLWLKKTSAELSLPAISTQFLKSNLSDCLQAIEYLVKDSFDHWPLDKLVEQQPQAQAQAQAQASVDSTANTPADGSAAVSVDTTTPMAVEQPSNENQQSMPIQPQMTHFSAHSQAMNRDQAFGELRKIADYFAVNEPHSPVSFLLEKAIRWGYMSLPELMAELVTGNDKVLGHIKLITGIDDEKAKLPVSSTTAPTSDNRSTDASVSAITGLASDSISPAPTSSVQVNTKEPIDSAAETQSVSDVEFEW